MKLFGIIYLGAALILLIFLVIAGEIPKEFGDFASIVTIAGLGFIMLDKDKPNNKS